MDASLHMPERGAHRRSQNRGLVGDLSRLAEFDINLKATVAGALPSSTFWCNPRNVLAVNRALFKRDMGIQLTLHESRLIPTLLSRLNYILSIQDLLLSCDTSPASWDHPTPILPLAGGTSGTETPRIIDIGTGYGAALALLMHRETGWGAVATDIDDLNLSGAADNVATNAAASSIVVVDARAGQVVLPAQGTASVKHVTTSSTMTANSDMPILLPALDHVNARVISSTAQVGHGADTATSELASAQASTSTVAGPTAQHAQVPFFASVCNPPFFSSEAEARQSSGAYLRSSCTGAPVELVYEPRAGDEGGEVAFVSRMIRESGHPQARGACVWYSSMLGKASSRDVLLPLLTSLAVPHVRTGEMYQGRTARWWIAWSWLALPQYCRHEAWQYVDREGHSSVFVQPQELPLPSASDRMSQHSPTANKRRKLQHSEEGLGAGNSSPYVTDSSDIAYCDPVPLQQCAGGALTGGDGQPQRSAEKQRACRAFIVHLDSHSSMDISIRLPLKAYAVSAACRRSYYAVPSAADCVYIQEAKGGSKRTQASLAGPMPMSELRKRIDDALAAFNAEGKQSESLGHKHWALHTSQSVSGGQSNGWPETDVNLCHSTAGLQDATCLYAWAGAVQSSLALLYRYEVQVLAMPAATGGAHGTALPAGHACALVAVCLLGPVGADWQAFERFCDRLQQDVYRTSRRWRRQARLQGETVEMMNEARS